MAALLEPREQAQADALGWQLAEIYDVATEKFIVGILPAERLLPGSAFQTELQVVHLAKTGNELAIKSLRLVMDSYQTKKLRKKK